MFFARSWMGRRPEAIGVGFSEVPSREPRKVTSAPKLHCSLLLWALFTKQRGTLSEPDPTSIHTIHTTLDYAGGKHGKHRYIVGWRRPPTQTKDFIVRYLQAAGGFATRPSSHSQQHLRGTTPVILAGMIALSHPKGAKRYRSVYARGL